MKLLGDGVGWRGKKGRRDAQQEVGSVTSQRMWQGPGPRGPED